MHDGIGEYGGTKLWMEQLVVALYEQPNNIHGALLNLLDYVCPDYDWDDIFNEAHYVQAGLESYSSSASAPIEAYSGLSYTTYEEGWQDYTGQKDNDPAQPMCGSWDGTTTWNAGESNCSS
jgi:hypothetical protein